MRKFIAFITLAFSLLVAAVVGVPVVADNLSNGTEFDGGYSILYHITNKDGIDYKGSALNSAIDKVIDTVGDRLNTLNVSNPEIAIVNSDNVLVTIPDVEDNQLSIIRYALANNGSISIRDTSDNDLCPEGYTASDIIKSVEIISQGSNVYTAVKLKNAEVFEQITSSLAASYSGSDESPVANFVLWIGFEESYTDEMKENLGYDGDSYSDFGTNEYATFKVLSQIAVDTTISEDFTINSSVSLANISLYNKILNQDSQSYILNEQYYSPVGSYRAENTPTFAIIAGVVGLVALAVILFIAYRFAGLVSALSIIVYSILTLVVYNLFGGLFGAETIVALVVGIVLAVGANVIFLERIKDEIKKGKSIQRSYDEGSKKSVSTVLDSNVVVLIAALAFYLFGSQIIKSFAAIMIISQVIIIVIVVLLTRFMFSLLCSSSVVSDPTMWFGVKKESIKDINSGVKPEKTNRFEKVNFISEPKKKFAVSGIIAVAGIVFGLLFGLISGSVFNNNASQSEGTRIYFRTVNTDFATVEKAKETLKSDDYVSGKTPSKIVIDVDSIEVSSNDLVEYASLFEEYNVDLDSVSRNKVDVYSVTVYYETQLGSTVIDELNTKFEAEESKFFNEDEDINILKTNYTCGTYVPYTSKVALLNGLLVLGMTILFVFIYMLIRFNISYAITALATIVINEILFFALAAVIRFSVGTELIAIALAVAVFTINNLSISFDMLNDNIKEARDVVWNKDSRSEYINLSLQQSAYGNAFVAVSAILLAVLLLGFIGWSIISIPVFVIVSIVVVSFGTYFLMPHVWTYIDEVFANAKAKAKQKAALKAQKQEKSNEPEEYTFFGIND